MSAQPTSRPTRPHFIFCQHGAHGRPGNFDFLVGHFIKQALSGHAAAAPVGTTAPVLLHPTVSTSRAQHTFLLHATAAEAESAAHERKAHTRCILTLAPEVTENEGLRALAALPKTAVPPTAWLWHSLQLQGRSSDAGVRDCGARIVPELAQSMTAYADTWDTYYAATASTSTNPEPLVAGDILSPKKPAFSVVCHSFGGVITREVLYLLHRDHAAVLARFHSASWIAVASPLCGVTELPWWKHWGAKAIGRFYSRTYQELLLDEGVTDVSQTTLGGYMVDDAHLDALRAFRRRILVPNTMGDSLVAFKTSALVTDDSDDTNLLLSVAADSAAAAAAVQTPAAGGGVTVTQEGGEKVTVGASILLPRLAAAAPPTSDSAAAEGPTHGSQREFARGLGTRHHEIATAIARRIREAMDWEVWPVCHSTAPLQRMHSTVIRNPSVVEAIVTNLLTQDETN